ncbi:MAG: MFS transporter, partial [Brasilonema sp.]
FLFGLEIYIVNLVLPMLVELFNTNFAMIQWIAISYVLTLTVFVLGAARLGDMYNKKWLYLGGLILFTISSLLCGLASTVNFLLVFRTLQGLGAVFMSALGTAIITEVFPKEERGRALGILNGIFTLGIALGPGIGGLLIGFVGWRFIFWMNVPIGLIACLIVAFAVPSSDSKEVASNVSKFDVIGAVLMTVTLTCLTIAVTQLQNSSFDSLTELIVLVVAAVGLGCFLVVESRVSEPILDLEMFRSLEFSLSLLLGWMVFIIIGALQLLLPFFLDLIKHYPPQLGGFLLTVLPMSSALMAPLAGTLSDRFGERIISLIGLLLMVFGCWTISTLDTSSLALGFVVRVLPLRLGLEMFFSSNNSAVMGAVPRERLGIASGLLSLSRSLGLTTGVSLMGVLFSTLTIASTDLAPDTDVTNAPVEGLVFGFDTTFRVTALIAIASIILVTVIWWLEQRKVHNNRESASQ